MKHTSIIALLLLLVVGCGPQSSSHLTYPCVLVGKSQGNAQHDFWSHTAPCVTVVDAEGDHYTECGTGWSTAISDCYNVGDTIR